LGIESNAMTVAATIFQASDLNQRGRAVLDAARGGEARVRDKDGASFLVVPEHRLRTLIAVAQAAANLATIEQALATAPADLSLADYGDWTWLRHLPADDLPAFLDDARQALIVAAREETLTVLDATLRDWRVTAEELSDPLRRAILLGEHRAGDFVEAARPGQPEA
jgi:hypothetical protein